jgi:hypothetical protein
MARSNSAVLLTVGLARAESEAVMYTRASDKER